MSHTSFIWSTVSRCFLMLETSTGVAPDAYFSLIADTKKQQQLERESHFHDSRFLVKSEN